MAVLTLILVCCLVALIACNHDDHDHDHDVDYGPGLPQYPQFHRVIRSPHIPVDESDVVHPGRVIPESSHNAHEHLPDAHSAESRQAAQNYREFLEQQQQEQDYLFEYQFQRQHDEHHHEHEHGPHCNHDHGHEQHHQQQHQDLRAQFADILPPTPHLKRREGRPDSGDAHRQPQHQHEHGHGHSHSHSADSLASFASLAESLGLGGVIQFVKNFLSNYDEKDSFVLTILFTAAIGLIPIAILPIFSIFLYNLQTKSVNTILLDALLAFAAGGLLGDAFLHLIPHAFEALPHSHVHDHSAATAVGVSIVLGYFLFFALESLSASLCGGSGGHGHSHGGGEKNKNNETSASSNGKSGSQAAPTTLSNQELLLRAARARENEHDRMQALLSVLSDFGHNFTDGLAIAASFQASLAGGVITSLAILLHEFPHEIGDMAILVKAGTSMTNVVAIQILTALGALVGAMAGHYLSFLGNSIRSVILPFTAGGFIYVATSIIFQLQSKKKGFLKSALQLITFAIGVLLMRLICEIE